MSKLLYVPYDLVKTAPSYVEALPHNEGRNRTCRKKSPKIELPNNGKRPPKNSRSPPTCKWLHISKLLYVPYDSVKTAPSYVEALPHSEGRNRTCRKKSPKIEFQTTVNGLPKILEASQHASGYIYRNCCMSPTIR